MRYALSDRNARAVAASAPAEVRVSSHPSTDWVIRHAVGCPKCMIVRFYAISAIKVGFFGPHRADILHNPRE